MLCPLNSLQYSVNINFMKTLGNPKLLVTQLWYWLSFGVGNLSCSIFWVCLCFGIVSKSERNHVKLAWNVSCAHVPVRVNTVQIRYFIHVVFCLWSFPEIRVALPWVGICLEATGLAHSALGGGARAHATKNNINNNNSNQIILTVIWQTVGKE